MKTVAQTISLPRQSGKTTFLVNTLIENKKNNIATKLICCSLSEKRCILDSFQGLENDDVICIGEIKKTKEMKNTIFLFDNIEWIIYKTFGIFPSIITLSNDDGPETL